MKGASSSQKEKAPAVDSSRFVASTRSRVDEDSGSGEHGSRPQTSGTPGQASADPVSASPIQQLTGDFQRVYWLRSQSCQCLKNQTFKTQGALGCQNTRGSSRWMISHHPRATSSYRFDRMGKALTTLLPDTLYQLKSQLKSRMVPDFWRSLDDLVNPYSQMNAGETVQTASSKHRVIPDSLVYLYTLANPDRLTNPDSRFLSDSQLNPDSQK